VIDVTRPDADGIIYDKATGLVLVSCGDEGVLVTITVSRNPHLNFLLNSPTSVVFLHDHIQASSA
jgi:hypothetical protein